MDEALEDMLNLEDCILECGFLGKNPLDGYAITGENLLTIINHDEGKVVRTISLQDNEGDFKSYLGSIRAADGSVNFCRQKIDPKNSKSRLLELYDVNQNKRAIIHSGHLGSTTHLNILVNKFFSIGEDSKIIFYQADSSPNVPSNNPSNSDKNPQSQTELQEGGAQRPSQLMELEEMNGDSIPGKSRGLRGFMR